MHLCRNLSCWNQGAKNKEKLITNVSQAYLAFFVINDLRMAHSAKALVPAIIYISSFVVSVVMQEISWTGERLKAYYAAGGIIWLFCGSCILILPQNMSSYMYYPYLSG
ncbi:Major facilitator superfamily protein [Euphorbia peplus]|nr:Major facilitator superfamily protein [Euphorbia peplus]